MGLGRKQLNMVKVDTGRQNVATRTLCKLASRSRRGTWCVCRLQSFLRSAQKVEDLVCRRKGEFEDKARADHVRYKREMETYNPPTGKMDIQGHQHTQACLLRLLFWASSANHRTPSLIQCGCLSIPCCPQESTLAYLVWVSEHLLLTNKATSPNPSWWLSIQIHVPKGPLLFKPLHQYWGGGVGFESNREGKWRRRVLLSEAEGGKYRKGWEVGKTASRMFEKAQGCMSLTISLF